MTSRRDEANKANIVQSLCYKCAKEIGLPGLDSIIKNYLEEMNLDVDLDQIDIDEIGEKLGGFPNIDELANSLPEMSPEQVEGLQSIVDFLINGPNAAKDHDDEEDDDDDEYSDGYDQEEEEPFGPFMGFTEFGRKEQNDEGSGGKAKTKTKTNKKKLGGALTKYGTNLNERAAEGLIDNIVGREKEIDRMIQILNRRQKNNPILIGEPGVGKTAVAEGLAVRIVQKKVPEKLLDKIIVQLDMTGMVAGTQFRGQFEQRMKDVIKQASANGNVILIIDEVHSIMSAGDSTGSMNAANILKPALAKGDFQIIGTTTLDEYRKSIEKDSALERRFQPIIIEEPTEDEAVEILEGIKKYYEDFHGVRIPKKSVEAAVRLSKRYIADRYLPDKAIDVIDEAGSKKNLGNVKLSEKKKKLVKFEKLLNQHEELSKKGDYEGAANVRTEFLKLKNEIDKLDEESVLEITEDDIAEVVESIGRVPVQRIGKGEAKRLLELEKRLHRRVIAQNNAVDSVSAAVRRSRSGFKKNKKPSSFIFVGPTGVGKTELAKAVAEEVFGSEDAMIRFDMSEFMEKHTVSKLIGSPPGYVGYDDGGKLTELIRRKPYSVVLLDEIEKAHPDVFNILLQILDDGRLTDSKGRVVHFNDAIIIMTSNVGTSDSTGAIGFGAASDTQKSRDYIREELKKVFRPEFLNRVDNIAVFDTLTMDDCRQVLELQLGEVMKNLETKNMSMDVGQDVKDFLLERGFSEKYGARPIRREITVHMEDQISEKYLKGEVADGDKLRAYMKDGEVVIERVGRASNADEAMSESEVDSIVVPLSNAGLMTAEDVDGADADSADAAQGGDSADDYN